MDARNEQLEPFIEAATTTLREMAGVEVFVREVWPTPGVEAEDVSVALQLLAKKPGWIVLGAPASTADPITRRVLNGIERTSDAEMIRDCLAEVLNVLAGQAKALVYGTERHFDLATPTAPPAELFNTTADWQVVRFESEVGPFTLYVRPPLAADSVR